MGNFELMPQLTDDLGFYVLYDKAFVYNPTSSKVHTLNSAARIVYEGCAEQQATKVVLRRLLNEFAGASEAQVLQDMHEFIDEMRCAGLLRGSKG